MRLISLVFSLALAMTGTASAEPPEDRLRRLAETELRAWAANPTIVNAVRTQNRRHESLGSDEIIAMDGRWQAEMASASRPMVQALLANPVSSFLSMKKRSGKGRIAAISVLDGKGMAVGLSDATPHYWHGNQAGWRKAVFSDSDAIHVEPARRHPETGRWVGRVSLPVVDTATRHAIGAVSVDFDMASLTD